MSRLVFCLAGVAAVLISVQASAQLPAPVLQYETWPAVAGAVANTGTSVIPGTLYNAATVSYPAGPDDGTAVPPTTAIHFNDGTGGGGTLTTGINTNQTLASVSAADTSFTMSAWVNLDDTSGDNMVFGTNGGGPMHLGFRGSAAYFGFWGNDSNSGNIAVTGAWHHFAWVYNATGGLQNIYEDGVLLNSSGGHGTPGQGADNLTVGTNNGNGGDLNGAIDDARVYNSAFSDAQVAALFADSSKPDLVPEPSSIVLAGVGLVGLLAAYRRRNA